MRGQSLADLSLVRLWNGRCVLHPTERVKIWSYDIDDLSGYDRRPSGFGRRG